ncbi:MAG TPA: 30S ribosomal protein S5 [Candidatus Saccharimonadales bacterium]|nr:30S ribosomal protein S5 [Candidatus Saccharimonadales bacterium]
MRQRQMQTSYSDPEFSEKIVQVSRVSKKTKGGNKIGFSVLVVVGDRKGQVGVGLGKAPEVQSAIKKGVSYAKKHLITVPMKGTTIPHPIYVKHGAAKVLLRPASTGTGVIAGGSVRAVAEAAGIHDILSKVLGTNNKASNVYATLEAFRRLRTPKAPKEKVEKVEAVKNETE